MSFCNMLARNRLLHYLCKHSVTKCKILTCANISISYVNLLQVSNTHNAAAKKVSQSKEVKPENKFVNRTHTCGELSRHNVGETVEICGWLQYHRLGKFLILRDCYGLTQCLIPEERKDLLTIAEKLSYESVLNIIGTVVLRPDGQNNKQMSTGEIEVLVDKLEVAGPSTENLPFSIRHFLKPTEQTGMKHRYLVLRFPEMQANLRLRSWVIFNMRDYLQNQCNFVEVETPTLFRQTPGGAHEFVVPTKFENKFYCLTQSPQQLKQLLMIGGIDRYFQVARCYRDETSRNDRQPEFTQMDIELSFVDREGVMELTEGLISKSWPNDLGELTTPFPKLTYEDVMEKYGLENPDLRIPFQIENVTEILRYSDSLLKKSNIKLDDSFRSYAIVFPEKEKYLTKSVQTKLSNIAKQNFKDAKFIQLKITEDIILNKMKNLFSDTVSSNLVEKLALKNTDVLFLTYGQKRDTQKLIGKIRVEFTDAMESAKHYVRSKDFKFIWIYDFPLFEFKKDQTLESAHHPFTRPHNDDIAYLDSDPTKVRGLQYDLVLNGSEIAGGSIRIHERDLQKKVFQLLNIESTNMEYFLNAFNYGVPPHGGIAIGLDRYISILCGTKSIRDVIAFPKTIDGNDVMSGAPSTISDEQSMMYHLKQKIKI